jgi:hypothetical protein
VCILRYEKSEQQRIQVFGCLSSEAFFIFLAPFSGIWHEMFSVGMFCFWGFLALKMHNEIFDENGLNTLHVVFK